MLLAEALGGNRSMMVLWFRLLHGLDILGNLEWCFSLALDFIDGNTRGEFDQSKAIGPIDVKDALQSHHVSTISSGIK